MYAKRAQGGFRSGRAGDLLVFKHRQNIPSGVFEPRYRRTLAAGNTPLVRLELSFLVNLETHAQLGKLLHCSFNVYHGKIEDSEGCWNMVGLPIDEDVAAASNMQLQHLPAIR